MCDPIATCDMLGYPVHKQVIQHLIQIEVNCNEVYLEHTLLATSVSMCA